MAAKDGKSRISCYTKEEFKREDKVEYGKFLCMLPEVFYELLREIEPSITKQNTVMQDSLPPDMKLAVTIRYLATGACYTDLGLSCFQKTVE